MKCLLWICRLKDGRHGNIRELALQFAEDHPEANLKQLHQHVKNFTRLQTTSKTIAGANTNVVYRVDSNKPSNPCRG
ncbi:hypothetical protein MZO24_017270, partial [Enterococcus faecalis]|nr:hypothetical protein [Enterococcus faecalis]